MAKLVEIAAKHVNEWPEGADFLFQTDSGKIFFDIDLGGFPELHDFVCEEIAEDLDDVFITRARWEAERARIAGVKAAIEQRAKELSKCGMGVWIDDVRSTNQQATEEAREIARTGSMTSEEQELADIACGKRSKEDQALWDKVAMDQFRDFMQSEREQHFSLNQCDYARLAAEAADAFMAERAKRLKGV